MATVAACAGQLREEAERALRLARIEPGRVRSLVDAGRHWAPLDGDDETVAIAELALGQAAAELHDLPAARAHLLRARARAASAGASSWAAEANTTLALVLANAGELDAALRQLEEREFRAVGAVAARATCQRALILQRLGRAEEALEAYRDGLSAMRRVGDRAGEARVFIHRGLLHAYVGRFEAARAELRRSERLYRQLGLDLEAAYARHNLGFVAARQGDLPAALRAYEEAARAMAAAGAEHPAATLDYCETLLRASLFDEAREVGARAVALLEQAGMETDLAEAHLLLAEVELAAGHPAEAEQLALLAQLSFHGQGRRAWEVMARYAWLRARWGQGDRSEATMLAARSLADGLRASGWAGSATHARVVAARIALERGEFELAAADLRAVARHRRRAPAEMRVQAWHAEALLRWSRGDGAGAQSALRAGIAAVSSYRSMLGATELRVNAGTHARELARLAIHIAVTRGEAERVLTWAERCRASAVRLPPVRPPGDEELAARLAELRAVEKQLEETAGAGQDTAALVRRKAALEDAIRRKTWHAAGFGAHEAAPPSSRELRRALGERVLVEYVDDGDALYAVTVRDGRSALHRVGPLADIELDVDSLRFALERVASGAGRPGSVGPLGAAVGRAADRIDAALLGPLRHAIGDRAVVVVPTGQLHLVPWGALPSCRGRPVSVSPSAALWVAAASRSHRPRSGGGAVLAAGPGLSHARRELDELAAIYPDATRLQGPAATARSVAAALDGAALAHVVAHGSFRADNPLFSSLRLADGPLTVYELERLAKAPDRLVLSSCHGGVASVRHGNELLGLSSALFALGTSTLVASALLVGDRETQRLMVDFHRLLARGVDPPAALAHAQERVDRDDARAVATALSFVCLGA